MLPDRNKKGNQDENKKRDKSEKRAKETKEKHRTGIMMEKKVWTKEKNGNEKERKWKEVGKSGKEMRIKKGEIKEKMTKITRYIFLLIRCLQDMWQCLSIVNP